MSKLSAGTILYALPRLLSIIISLVVFSFLSETIVGSSTTTYYLALSTGFLVVIGVGVSYWKTRNGQLLSLIPTALWSYFLVLFIGGGVDPNISIVQFLFLSILTGSVTMLSYYSWINGKLGGAFYLALAAVYLFIGFRRVETTPMLLVLLVLVTTGALFYLSQGGQTVTATKTSKRANKQKVTKEKKFRTTKPVKDLKSADHVLQGWQALSNDKKSPKMFKNIPTKRRKKKPTLQ